MKKVKKPVFFIVVTFILAMTYLTIFGVYTHYGDIETVHIRGVKDIRWGIDIRGGVDVTFMPDVDSDGEVYDADRNNMDAARSVIETRMIARNITDYEIYVDYSADRIIVRFPWQSGDAALDPAQAVRELGETAMLTFREGMPEGDQTHEDLPIVITGADVERANAFYDHDDNVASRRYKVNLKLKDSGREAFAEATERLAGTQIPISIWLDDYCFSNPIVDEKIDNGQAVISGHFDADGVISLANRINGGSLPFALVHESFSTISPTLGMGARDAMAIAGIIAFAVIIIFMIAAYRLLGLVASIGLLGQIVCTLAVITGFFGTGQSFTLTIPGIAGIILSVGMGVDANVITAERIKEELRTGKTLDGALQAGYKRAFTAIFDGNVTLLIITIILMGAFGTPDSFASTILRPLFFMFGPSAAGAIYSFGFTLTVGALLNFVFGVLGSRLMTYSLSKFKPMRKTKYYTKEAAKNG